MIARVSGARSGIAEYLKKGQKKGREYTREEIDERIVLSGDLDITKHIIHKTETRDSDSQKYLHIVMSFKESEVNKEVLSGVTKDLEEFILSAYKKDEYNFYAEAHIPKIKEMEYWRTGEVKERKPHIHVVIPQVNLVSGKRLDPLGLTMHHVKHLDAFQEKTNEKYSLISPKEGIKPLKTSSIDYDGDLKEWHSIKSNQIKHIAPRDRKEFNKLSEKDKLEVIDRKKEEFNKKHRVGHKMKPEDFGLNPKDGLTEVRMALMNAGAEKLKSEEIKNTGVKQNPYLAAKEGNIIQPPVRSIENNNEKENKTEKKAEKSTPVKMDDVTFKVNSKGHIDYYEDKVNIVTDEGKKVHVKQTSNTAIELALRISMEKFGNTLDVKGTKDYKEKAIMVVAKEGLNVKFTDPAMNQKLQERRQQMEKGRNIIQAASKAYRAADSKQQDKAQDRGKGYDMSR
ncbi:hypothetical protein AB832_08380 [Flavobacteriaceae bacterium (ex Bugula neritina AB1)]|nr:hypothetical protein AB832_08380 [Flavobacteriaceae bacterium (ex Bugula neritina AB1)]